MATMFVGCVPMRDPQMTHKPGTGLIVFSTSYELTESGVETNLNLGERIFRKPYPFIVPEQQDVWEGGFFSAAAREKREALEDLDSPIANPGPLGHINPSIVKDFGKRRVILRAYEWPAGNYKLTPRVARWGAILEHDYAKVFPPITVAVAAGKVVYAGAFHFYGFTSNGGCECKLTVSDDSSRDLELLRSRMPLDPASKIIKDIKK